MSAFRRTWLVCVACLPTWACTFDSSSPLLGGSDAGPGARADASTASDVDGSVRQPDPDANAVPTSSLGHLYSHPTDTAPEIDGYVDNLWPDDDITVFSITSAGQYYGVHEQYGYDASLQVRSIHDADAIYFLFEIHDDLLVNDSQYLYQDDAIEIYLDATADGQGPYADDDHWLVISADNHYQSLGPAHIAVDGEVVPTPDGYRIEMALSKSELGLAGNAVDLGFNMGLTDDDDLGDSDADAYGLWYLPGPSDCEDCCEDEDGSYAWCDTSLFGELTLLSDLP